MGGAVGHGGKIHRVALTAAGHSRQGLDGHKDGVDHIAHGEGAVERMFVHMGQRE